MTVPALLVCTGICLLIARFIIKMVLYGIRNISKNIQS